jgi:hypothetical protein
VSGAWWRVALAPEKYESPSLLFSMLRRAHMCGGEGGLAGQLAGGAISVWWEMGGKRAKVGCTITTS